MCLSRADKDPSVFKPYKEDTSQHLPLSCQYWQVETVELLHLAIRLSVCKSTANPEDPIARLYIIFAVRLHVSAPEAHEVPSPAEHHVHSLEVIGNLLASFPMET